jgi:hypothetical protein
MLPLILIIGFAMATLGVALLVFGEVPFIAGRRISAVRSRLIGGTLVGFLPLALAGQQLCKMIFGPEAIEGPVVTAIVFVLCCVVIAVILFRVVFPKSAPRNRSSVTARSKKNPFDKPTSDTDASDPWPPMPAAKKPPRKSPKPTADDNPFDFS